jgi:hypothetical protein
MLIEHYRTQTQTQKAFVAHWDNVSSGDECEKLQFSQYTDKSVQVAGTFGGASLSFEGSNDGINWAVLTDPQGNPLTFVSGKIEMVTEASNYARPSISGGDGSTSLTVLVLLKE